MLCWNKCAVKSNHSLTTMNCSSGNHIFRQLFDSESWTFTYLLGCAKTREAVLIDPVDTQVTIDHYFDLCDPQEKRHVQNVDVIVQLGCRTKNLVFSQAERDLKLIKELKLQLKYALNTHCHADHITGTGILRTHTGCQTMISKNAGAKADILLNDGDDVKYGEHVIKAVSTPGHTDGCMAFIQHDQKFAMTGDTLLIRACGRTDFQQGSPETLYESVHKKIFSLPDEFALFPAHDYKGMSMTTVWEEKQHNPRLTKSKEEFVEIMKNLGLAYPKKIDEALPWNLKCGPSQLGEIVRMDQ